MLLNRANLGDPQAEVLQVVSKFVPVTVADTHRIINERRDESLAYSTVFSVMRVLEEEEEGVLERERAGRAHVYRPVPTEELPEPAPPVEITGSRSARGDVAAARGQGRSRPRGPQGRAHEVSGLHTVMSVMKRLESKLLLERWERDGRAFVRLPSRSSSGSTNCSQPQSRQQAWTGSCTTPMS